MGTTPASKNMRPSVHQNEDDLQFYMQVNDINLGPVRIYRSKKIPLYYILKYEKTVADSKIYNLFQKIEQYQSSSLLTLYGFSINRQTCCGKIAREKITSYWEYYNFYFNQYLEKKSKLGCLFVQSQIWHIVDVVCDTYMLFRKFNTFYEVNPSTFLISPQGKLKALWSHLRSQNSHLKFIQYFDTNKLQSFYYSPEQMEYIYLGQRTVKLNFDKCNSFRLGIILLYCLCLSDPLYMCYNPSLTKINFNIIKNLIASKIAPSYSQPIITLLTNLLKENPKQRLTLAQVAQNYSKYMSPQFQLRVCGNKPLQQQNRSLNFQNNLITNNSEVGFNQNIQQPFTEQFLHEKDKSVFSDVKTVKMTYSNKKI